MNGEITLPLWLFVAQWFLLFALGVLVIIAYRQIGYMLGVKEPSSTRDGLPVGEIAPSFQYLNVFQDSKADYFNPKGQWSVLLFADPNCSGCQKALIELEKFQYSLKSSTELLVVTSASEEDIGSVDVFRHSSITIGQIKHEVMTKLYRTQVTPFLYIIDPTGIVRTKGIADSSIRKMLNTSGKKPLTVITASQEPETVKH
jgi:thioredoxin-related protein